MDYFIDFETHSKVDVRDVGSHAYARDPTTGIIILGWAAGEGPVRIEKPPMTRLPFRFNPGEDRLISHNIEFELAIIKRFFPEEKIPFSRVYDTAALSAHAGLPSSLDEAGESLGIANKKIKFNWKDYTEEQLFEYCRQDVKACRELFRKLPEMTPRERQIFIAHLIINFRGVPIDRYVLERLNEICARAEIELRKTEYGNLIYSPVALRRYLNAEGYDVENAQADTLEKLLEDPLLDEEIRQLLNFRLKAGRASVKKLPRMLQWANEDDRIRGLHRYFGGHTGRFAGQGPQFQNLIRECSKEIEEDISRLDEDNPFGPPEETIHKSSLLIRPVLTAGPKKKFVVADYSAIESRQLAWLVGAEEILQMYRDGYDLYKVMASRIYNKRIEDITDEERRIGKNAILGCGYGLGPKAFVSYVYKNTGQVITFEQSKEIVYGYRKFLKQVPAGWNAIERAALEVLEEGGWNRGRFIFDRKLIMFSSSGTYVPKKPNLLACRLPSGRIFRWHFPGIVELPDNRQVLTYASYRGDPKKEIRAAIRRIASSMNVDPAPYLRDVPRTPQGWMRNQLWGGTLIENVIQALCRDLMAESIVRLEKEKIPVVMHVHDEIICEVPEDFPMQRIVEILQQVPDWAKGSVINVGAWEGKRYKK